MVAVKKYDWIIIASLLSLSLIPILAGLIRLVQLATGAEVTLDNARFFAAPLPVILHIVSSTAYCILGVFQFAPTIRVSHLRWHRLSGLVIIPFGLVAALSGVWMTQNYLTPAGTHTLASYDGASLHAIRLLVGFLMCWFLFLSVRAIRRRNFQNHGAWMMRCFALGLGAGTQVFTHIPWFLFSSIQGEFARTMCMGAGWLINIIVVEWLILRKKFL